MTTDALKPHQAHALLDILTHHQTYSEIRAFRHPNRLTAYGPPFNSIANQASTSPSLQTLVSSFLLPLPGLKNASPDFWHQRVGRVIANFEDAELSESYDKGNIGIRRTLATAFAALIEYPVRGVFAGFDEPSSDAGEREYDLGKAEDLQTACRDALQAVVYGGLVDEGFKKAAETDRLEDHQSIVRAAHEYGLVNLASFIHYTLVLSPKGQQLLAMIDQVNKLIPYGIIRQTLKIGNVASMISAMMKVVLAKMSMASVTNWVGWTQNADEGMNLMQQIISTVLHYDTRDFKSKASKIEKDKDGPKKEQLEALKKYIQKPREEHDTLRERSKSQGKSIVAVILEDASVSTNLTESQHTKALAYLSHHLSIRDRDQIVRVLCHSNPDHLTQAVKDMVAAYEPVIRQLHEAVDLSESLWDFERFLKDTIKIAKIPPSSSDSQDQAHNTYLKNVSSTHSKPKTTSLPTVGAFVQLLKKHQYSLHKFLHQIAKNGPVMTSWFHEYVKTAAANFRRSNHDSSSSSQPPDTSPSHSRFTNDAGALTPSLNDLFNDLPQDKKSTLLPILDAQASYLASLHAASAARLSAVLTSPQSTHPVLSEPYTPYRAGTSSRPASNPSSRNQSPTRQQPRAPSPRIAAIQASAASASASSTAANTADATEDRPQAQGQAPDTNPGPGAFLARWQALLDAADITPATMYGGDIRGGMAASVVKASRVGVAVSTTTSGASGSGSGSGSGTSGARGAESGSVVGSNKAGGGGAGAADEEKDDDYDDDNDVFEEALERIDHVGLEESEKAPRPDTRPVVEALGEGFAALLGERGCDW